MDKHELSKKLEDWAKAANIVANISEDARPILDVYDCIRIRGMAAGLRIAAKAAFIKESCDSAAATTRQDNQEK